MPGPQSSDERPADFRRTALRLLRSMGTHRRLVTTVLVLGIIGIGAFSAQPRLLGYATDAVISEDGADLGEAGRWLLAATALAALAWGLMVLQGRMVAAIVQHTAYRLREQTDSKLARLPLRYFDQRPRGEIMSRATNDIDNLSQTLQQVLNRQFASILMIVAIPVMMLTISPLLTLVVAVSVPATLYAARVIGGRAQPNFAAQWKATGRLNGHVEEMYTGHALVTAFGRQAQAADEFTRHNEEIYQVGTRAEFLSGLIQPTIRFLGYLTYVAVAVVGGLRVAAGALSIGEIQAFIQYVFGFNQPVVGLAATSSQLQSAVASAERVFNLLDAEEEEPDLPDPDANDANDANDAFWHLAPSTGAGSEMPEREGLPGGNGASGPANGRVDVRGRVGFEDVSFRYKADEPLIEDLNLAVDPGQSVAIVGPTGAGKTTLVNLLMRFYEIDSGRITLDGHDTAAMPREQLRGLTGMVLQDTWLFSGTIAENIAYGRPDATRDEIVAAATAVRADHLIRTLPDGYDTLLDEEGGNLSAGERQLITIARAFLVDPAILVLDEATSSVDTRTEMLIQAAMGSLREGRTSFIIAHRLSTIRDADLILVMEAGRIVEQGSHEELLAREGAYARLYAAQFRQPALEAS